jgi:AbrB family looped-hinge helix DNA binding protein
MTSKITVDKAGRVILPKRLRDELHISAGDSLQLESEGERINLRPIRRQAALKKEFGASTDVSITDLIDRDRGKRIREQF